MYHVTLEFDSTTKINVIKSRILNIFRVSHFTEGHKNDYFFEIDLNAMLTGYLVDPMEVRMYEFSICMSK